MREKTNAVTQIGCLPNGQQLERKAVFIHEQGVRVTHTFELDRCKEGIA
jgi:hypothetical protein